jgi:hypothetical protein
MTRRFFAMKASGFLAAIGPASRADADVVDDAKPKHQAPKTKARITEIDLRERLYSGRDEVEWTVSYDVIRDDGSVDSRTASQAGGRKLQSGKGLAIELDLS